MTPSAVSTTVGTVDFPAGSITSSGVSNFLITGVAVTEITMTIPPTVPVFAGPSIFLQPTNVQILEPATGNPWTDLGNMINSVNTRFASFDLPASPTFVADQISFSVLPSSSLLTSYILGYAYEFRSIANTLGKSITSMRIALLDNAGIVKGGYEGVHEFDQTCSDKGMAEYTSDEMITLGADRITTFANTGNTISGASSLKATDIRTLADFGGFVVFPLNSGRLDGQIDHVSLKTVDFKIFITPPPWGEQIALPVSAVVAVSAATAGIALDPIWGSETLILNVSRALTVEASSLTSSAEAAQINGDEATQTQFYKFTIAAGVVAGLVGRSARQLMFVWRGRASGGSTVLGGIVDCVLLGELALAKVDGTVLIKGVGDGKLLWDVTHWKVYNLKDHFVSERDYCVIMDVSGLTNVQITDMNTNGFSILVRFNICNFTGTGAPMSAFLNGITALITMDPVQSMSIKKQALLLSH